MIIDEVNKCITTNRIAHKNIIPFTLIKAALVNNQHSNNPISEIEVLQKMAKERKKNITIYTENNRLDLANKEQEELLIINGFLPKAPSDKEIENFIKLYANNKETDMTMKDCGNVISYVQLTYPVASKSDIVRIFKTFINL